jgi:hypothetical protein
MIEAITRFIPFLQSAEVWVKVYFVVWLVASVGLVPAVLFAQKADTSQSKTAQTIRPSVVPGAMSPPFFVGQWPVTGETHYIDHTHSMLNRYEAAGPISDNERIAVLKNLFSGPFFIDTREERPPLALYVLCRTEQILRTFTRDARDGGLKSALGSATTRVIALRDVITQGIYGDAFDITEHFRRNGHDVSSFTSTLPATSGTRYDTDRATALLKQLRDFLRPFNIV